MFRLNLRSCREINERICRKAPSAALGVTQGCWRTRDSPAKRAKASASSCEKVWGDRPGFRACCSRSASRNWHGDDDASARSGKPAEAVAPENTRSSSKVDALLTSRPFPPPRPTPHAVPSLSSQRFRSRQRNKTHLLRAPDALKYFFSALSHPRVFHCDTASCFHMEIDKKK